MQLTEKLITDMAGYVNTGLKWDGAAVMCGLSRETFSQLVFKGRREPNSIEGRMVEALTQAEEDLKEELLGRVKDAARGGDKGAKRWLKDRGVTV